MGREPGCVSPWPSDCVPNCERTSNVSASGRHAPALLYASFSDRPGRACPGRAHVFALGFVRTKSGQRPRRARPGGAHVSMSPSGLDLFSIDHSRSQGEPAFQVVNHRSTGTSPDGGDGVCNRCASAETSLHRGEPEGGGFLMNTQPHPAQQNCDIRNGIFIRPPGVRPQAQPGWQGQ